MRDWLTIDLVLAALLVTSFTCVGLLALWAATSPRHWFVRTAVVLAVLSPFLLVPAYEVFLTVVLAIGVTRLGIAVEHLCRFRKLSSSTTNVTNPLLLRRFSLASGLLAVAVLAVILAIVVRLPYQVWQSWWLWSLGGASVGTAAYMASFAIDPRPTWWHRGLSFAAMIPQLFICFATYGVTMVVFTEIWSTPASTATSGRLAFWLLVSAITALLLVVGLALVGYGKCASQAATAENCSNSQERRLFPARPILILFALAVAALPLFVLGELLNPLPIPTAPVPNPNGHLRLVQLGKRLENSAVSREYLADPVDYAKLTAAVSKQSSDYDEIREALALPGWIPVFYEVEADLADTDATMALRRIQRALAAKCEVSFRNGDVSGAIAAYADMLRLAEAAHRGGLAIHCLVAVACEESAHRQVYLGLNSLGTADCLALHREIAFYDAKRRGIDDVWRRERVWSQRAYGWIGHLIEVMGRYAASDDQKWNAFDSVSNAYRRTQAIARLLMIELALRRYHLDHGDLPSQLDQLVPTYLAEVPADPFDSDQQPLRYVHDGASYVLYSVGPDGADDGGKPISERDFPGISLDGRGDLRLDMYFAPDEGQVGNGPDE